MQDMYFILELLKNDLLIWGAIITTVLYFLLTLNHGYWASRNVKYVPPVPFFGNYFSNLFCLIPGCQLQKNNYYYLKGERFGGYWCFWKPKLLILDPKLVEHIMIKDFSYFTDRELGADLDTDPLTRHLVNQNGENWKMLRTKLSPVFSSGKLKTMVQQIIDCSNNSLEYMAQKIGAGNTLEVRGEMASFTIDVIASCAFGLNLNTINDPDSQFKKLGRLIFGPSKETKMRGMLVANYRFLVKLLNWRRVSTDYANFFIKSVKDVIKYRVENNVHRNDFIQLLMEIRKEEEKQLKNGTISKITMDDVTITANSFVFLLAGYESTANTLSALLYELSKNPEKQEILYKEVKDVLKKHNGEITWETLADLNYLDCAINETLRKYPPIIELTRQAVKPYQIPNSNLVLPKGSVVLVPIYCLQNDPEYYPIPENFEPERFSEENKHKLVKGTFLPFGEGPRICIAQRFSRMEMKIAMTKIIMRYKLSINSRTITPLQFSTDTLFLVPVGGLWVDFTPRKNEG